MAELKFKNKKKAAQSSGPVSPADMVYAKLMVRLYTSDRLAFYYRLRVLLKNRLSLMLCNFLSSHRMKETALSVLFLDFFISNKL